MFKVERYTLSKAKMLYLLDKFKDDSSSIASLYIPPAQSLKTIAGLLETIGEAEQFPEDLAQNIEKSVTGAVLFSSRTQHYLVLPPFPVADERNAAVCEIGPLVRLLEQEFILALIVVRLGAFAIGVYAGEQLLSSKVGTGNVHSRHRQGGSSAHRFERHRDKQIETFFTRVGDHLREQLEPYAGQIRWVIYGGTYQTVLDFRKQCRFTQQFDARTLDLLLNIREPKQSGLEEAIRTAWSCRIVKWVRE
jgi:peptide subunit release factor 1 (eRF1)